MCAAIVNNRVKVIDQLRLSVLNLCRVIGRSLNDVIFGQPIRG